MTAVLPEPPAAFIVVPMLTISDAIGLFLGDLSRRSRSKSGRTAASYEALLDKFADGFRTTYTDVTEITADDCRGFLDGYSRKSPNYQATIYATLNSFLTWLYRQQRITTNPLDRVARPKRIASEDLDVTTLDTNDVPKLLDACKTESERLCIAVLAYLGPRRNAVSRLKVRDYDRAAGTIRFQEKGSKSIEKPCPAELVDVLERAFAVGALSSGTPDAYLIPPEGPLGHETTANGRERNDRVIWRIVKRVADNAGIEAHVHALRAAFAVFYLEQNPGDLVGLQELMGHRSIETTRGYLRKLDKRRAMEPVRSLSWAGVAADNASKPDFPQFGTFGFRSSFAVGAGGFEPPSPESLDAERTVRLPAAERPAKKVAP